MYTLITILIVIAAVLLTLLVLVQNSKGGGLASGFASGNQVMGAPKTADFLEKATWTLITVIFFLSIISVGFLKGKNAQEETQTTVAAPENEPAVDEAPENADFNTEKEAL